MRALPSATGGRLVASSDARSLVSSGTGFGALETLGESEITAVGAASEMELTGGSAVGSSEVAGNCAGAAGSETTSGNVLGAAVADCELVDGSAGGRPSPRAPVLSRFGMAGRFAVAEDEADGAGASGSQAGLSDEFVGSVESAAETGELVAFGSGGASDRLPLPRRGLESVVSGSVGTLSAV